MTGQCCAGHTRPCSKHANKCQSQNETSDAPDHVTSVMRYLQCRWTAVRAHRNFNNIGCERHLDGLFRAAPGRNPKADPEAGTLILRPQVQRSNPSFLSSSEARLRS